MFTFINTYVLYSYDSWFLSNVSLAVSPSSVVLYLRIFYISLFRSYHYFSLSLYFICSIMQRFSYYESQSLTDTYGCRLYLYLFYISLVPPVVFVLLSIITCVVYQLWFIFLLSNIKFYRFFFHQQFYTSTYFISPYSHVLLIRTFF